VLTHQHVQVTISHPHALRAVVGDAPVKSEQVRRRCAPRSTLHVPASARAIAGLRARMIAAPADL
jgi:hypothetical protein